MVRIDPEMRGTVDLLVGSCSAEGSPLGERLPFVDLKSQHRHRCLPSIRSLRATIVDRPAPDSWRALDLILRPWRFGRNEISIAARLCSRPNRRVAHRAAPELVALPPPRAPLLSPWVASDPISRSCRR